MHQPDAGNAGNAEAGECADGAGNPEAGQQLADTQRLRVPPEHVGLAPAIAEVLPGQCPIGGARVVADDQIGLEPQGVPRGAKAVIQLVVLVDGHGFVPSAQRSQDVDSVATEVHGVRRTRRSTTVKCGRASAPRGAVGERHTTRFGGVSRNRFHPTAHSGSPGAFERAEDALDVVDADGCVSVEPNEDVGPGCCQPQIEGG